MDAVICSNLYGRIEKTYASDIVDSARETANIKTSLLLYVIVDFAFNGISVRREGKTCILNVGYKYFSDTSKVECTALLSENSLDSAFYLKIAEYYARHVSPLNLTVSLKSYFGGGSQIKSEFDKLSLEEKLVLCIVDSDRVHPKGGEGGTSSSFTHRDKCINGFSLAKVIGVHEAESLVPLKLIEKVAIEKLDKKIDLCDEIAIYIQKDSRFGEYFDFKNGMSLEDAIALDKKYGKFWLDILSVNEKFSKRTCFIDKSCYGCDSCPRIDGFGEALLKHVVNELGCMNIRNLKHQLDCHLLGHWNEIGEFLLSWGCSTIGRAVRS